jgi:hypothetical protein
MPVVGFPSAAALPQSYAHIVTAFRQGLKEIGYVEGQNIAIEISVGCEIILATNEIARKEGFHRFGRLVTRSSFVTTATALLAIIASIRKNPNSATLADQK